MDDVSALPPEGHIKRLRKVSANPRRAYTNPSPATSRADSPFRSPVTPLDSPRGDIPDILAPTPRRHLLESSASRHWLHTPPLSEPTSSRAVSPQSAVGGPSSRRILHERHSSFSALFQEQYRDSSPASARAVKLEKHEADTAMGRRWTRWMHKSGIKQWVVPTAILGSTLFKLSIGLGSYSGEGTPPMYGDYEAQRHWMELTIHLPTSKWYTYDLQYWGLDYPPLTAYISWLCGIVAYWIEPSWVALDQSRGIETPGSKVFMRLTVVAMDALVYVPALIMFACTWQGSRSKRTQELSLLTLLFQPALLLIDFGHFQYNSVMLGFTLLAMNFFATGQDLIGAFFFVLSLGFKQMALYYAPAIGSYLLAKCLYLGPSKGGRLFIRLALVASLTFVVLFLPFLPPFARLKSILSPISRIFPFGRGLFEDKVANFWCASNVVFKWKNWASTGSLVKLSTALTFLGFLPSVLVLLGAGLKMHDAETEKSTSSETKSKAGQLHTPFLPLLPYALLTSSLSFFLFSFQVHEKTILLPLMPITLLLSGAHINSAVYSWGVLVNNMAVFSMWPLLKRDGQGVQYIALLLFWNRLIGYNPIRVPHKSFVEILSIATYTGAIGLHILEFFITPPARYPDLFSVLNVLISTPVFVLTWLWSIKCGIEVGWALGGLGTVSRKAVRPEPAPSDGAVGNGTGNVAGSYRQEGGRTVSLGTAQSRRRSSRLPGAGE